MTTDAQRRAAGESHAHAHSNGDNWWSWLITFLAIALPVLVLMGWFSIADFRVNGHYADAAIQRGDLLIPVLILCLEAVRRWCWEVKGGARWLKISRVVAPIWCGFAAFACAVGFFYATVEKASANSDHSIALITLVSLGIAGVLGTFAVILVGFSMSKVLRL